MTSRCRSEWLDSLVVEVFFVGLLVIVGVGIACAAVLAVFRLYRSQA